MSSSPSPCVPSSLAGTSTTHAYSPSMFVGEFLCVIPLLWNWFAVASKGRQSYLERLLKRSPGEGYGAVSQDEDAVVDDADSDFINHIPMRGWAICWMWFPAFFDSESVLRWGGVTPSGASVCAGRPELPPSSH